MDLKQRIAFVDYVAEIDTMLTSAVTIALCVFSWIFVPVFIVYLTVRALCL